MNIQGGLLGTIGNTPLIRLEGPSKATGCEILGKAEFLNPGGSVKDRTALFIVEDAENHGLLKPGGVIVEGTAGNTGIGLALVGNARGYRTIIVIPKTQSKEKIEMLRMCGAEVHLAPGVPYTDPKNYVPASERLAEELAEKEPNGVIWANQFDNIANRDGHYRTTGPEIWAQTDGQIDAFTCATGTGGTLAGVGRFLKEQNPKIRIALADPMGSALFNYFDHGELKAEGESITEGIGQSRVTKNLKDAPIDDWLRVTDEEALPLIFSLLKKEGFLVGGSTGINVVAAMKMAEKLGPGHCIVTLICDSGDRYQSKLFNPTFLRARGLPVPDWI